MPKITKVTRLSEYMEVICNRPYPRNEHYTRHQNVHYSGSDPIKNKQFRLNGEPLEITPNDWIPNFLGETSIQRKKRIAYEKIMKYVD